jgi:hypothetical protein
MIYDYIISLKNVETRTADIISQILYFIAFSYFAFFGFYPVFNKFCLVSAAAILICWLWLIIKQKHGKKVYFTSGLAIAALAWFSGSHANWWIGLFYIIAALAEREFKFPKEIGFSADGIIINSLFKKRHSWSEVNNAMIKEGMLTLDLKNNKIIQKEIAEDVPPGVEAEFNQFCRDRLMALSVEA